MWQLFGSHAHQFYCPAYQSKPQNYLCGKAARRVLPLLLFLLSLLLLLSWHSELSFLEALQLPFGIAGRALVLSVCQHINCRQAGESILVPSPILLHVSLNELAAIALIDHKTKQWHSMGTFQSEVLADLLNFLSVALNYADIAQIYLPLRLVMMAKLF